MTAAKQELPEKWKHPDNPAPELVWVWDAFMELTTCRSIGMALGPIPFLAIKDYALHFGITGLRFELFNKLIRAMDRVLLDDSAQKEKKAAKQAQNQHKRPARPAMRRR
jgi:hypothetical protein